MKRINWLWLIPCLVGLLAWVIIFPTFSGGAVEEVSVLRLTAAGDVIMHLPIVQSAYLPGTDTYDFRPCFEEVKDYLSRADLAVAVLESSLAAPDDRQFTGYPTFKAPPAIADALQWAGIDLVFTAHNHSLDKGVQGIRNTLAHLDRIGMPQTGNRNLFTEPPYKIIEKNGIKLGFLSYTTSTNGIPLPSEYKHMLNLLDYHELEKTIIQLKELKVDGIIAALHTGEEYQRLPSKQQQAVIDKLIGAGVDIVLGSHVHVIQPYEYRELTSSNKNESRHSFVAYSLGNFLSNQQWRYSDSGLMLSFDLEKSTRRPGITVKLVDRQPIWVHRAVAQGKYAYRVKMVKNPASGDSDPGLSNEAQQRMNEVWQEIEELLAGWEKR